MFSLSSSLRHSIPSLGGWKTGSFKTLLHSNRRIAIGIVPWAISCSTHEDTAPLDDDTSRDLFGIEVDLQPRDVNSGAAKLRSWFGPNGQYIRELPCPSCRGRGYTPCTECGIERSRLDCSECNGKGMKTCQKCFGDCVIWEESIDERPWEKARSSSPLKVKEDDEVDNLEIKLDIARRSKRVYQSPSPEVGLKISRSLRSLNAKTGLFSKRMKIIHRDPLLRAQRIAAIKKTKGTETARKQASEAMKAYFRDPENRLKRSLIMKGVQFYCSQCGEEGHRRHYCPTLQDDSSGKKWQYRCSLCGARGHNRRTCERLRSGKESQDKGSLRTCKTCGQIGHNRRTCSQGSSGGSPVVTSSSELKRTYMCSFCFDRGHNIRTCLNRKDSLIGK